MEAELHNVSFKEFKQLFGKQASRLLQRKSNLATLRKELGFNYSRDSFLQREHARVILQAIEQQLDVRLRVLEEYQDYPLLKEPIRKYCKAKRWKLQAKPPTTELAKPTARRFYAPRDLYQ